MKETNITVLMVAPGEHPVVTMPEKEIASSKQNMSISLPLVR